MEKRFGLGNFSCKEISERCGGKLFCQEDEKIQIVGVCTHSQEAKEGLLFLALPGEKSCGEQYINAALQAGCSAVLTQSCLYRNKVIFVDNIGEALLKLGKSFRHSNPAKVIAVTGSVGKTTAKEMIFSVLSKGDCSYRSYGNYNNLLGVPLSLFEVPKGCKYAVLEFGMNHRGEIEKLSLAANPDIAVITNIGTAHIGNLGSKEEIAKAKMEILSGLSENGIFIYPFDEKLITKYPLPKNSIGFSVENEKADCFASSVYMENGKVVCDLQILGSKIKNVIIPHPGKHLVNAALIAATVGKLQGLSDKEISAGIKECRIGNLRQSIWEKNGIVLIDDCYNASPESMLSAIELLSSFSRERKKKSICILGDMLELGSESEKYHRMIGEKIASSEISVLFCVGNQGKWIAETAKEFGKKEVESFLKIDDVNLKEKIKCELASDVMILFKASHAIGMEKLYAETKEMIENGEK